MPEPVAQNNPSPRGIPEMPHKLVGQPRRTWEMFCKVLDDAGVLTLADGLAVALMVQCWEELEECEQHIRAYGRVYEITDGGGNRRLCANPSVNMMAQAQRRLRAYLLDFGITPSGRRYITPEETADPDEPANPLAEFL